MNICHPWSSHRLKFPWFLKFGCVGCGEKGIIQPPPTLEWVAFSYSLSVSLVVIAVFATLFLLVLVLGVLAVSPPGLRDRRWVPLTGRGSQDCQPLPWRC